MKSTLQRIIRLLLVIAIAASLAVIPQVSAANMQDQGPAVSTLPFQDVAPTSWYYENVAFVCENGIMNGDSPTAFAPNGKLTRAMLFTVLGQVAGVDTTAYSLREFDFVELGCWYAPYME